MAKLVFRVSADYEEVVKLRNEIAKLKSELKGMDATRTPAALEALNDKLSSSTKRMNELVTVAANAGAAMEGDFKKKIFDASQVVNGFTEKIIAQKAVVKDVEADVKRLGEAYRSAMKKNKYGGNETAANNALSEYNAAKKALLEEKSALFALTQEQAQARLSVKKLRDEYALYRDDSKGTIAATNGMGLSLSKAFAMIGGVAFGKQLISDMIRVRGEFQAADTAIQTLLGNKEKADALMEKVRDYAKISPLEFSSVTQATQMMLGFNIEAEKVPRFLQAIGDVSMGDTQKFNSLTLAFSQMSAAGKLMGQDLNQMINAGFNPLQIMADKSGKSISQLKDEMSKGAVSAEMVQQAFIDATSAGGKFYQMSENASKTINGQLSMMQDAIDATFNEMGKKSEGFIIVGIKAVTKLIENYETIGRVLAGLVITYGTYKAALMATIAMQQLQTAGISALTAKEIIHYGWIKATAAAQKVLNATMLSNPYVLLATAIGGLVAVMVTMKDEQERINDSLKEYDDKKQKAIELEKEHRAEIDKLMSIAQDESLSTDNRRDALMKLNNEYPSIFAKYATEYDWLKNLKKIKEEIAELEGRRSVENSKNELDDVEKRIKELEAKPGRTQNLPSGMRRYEHLAGRSLDERSPDEKAELKALYIKRSELKKTISKNAADSYFKDLTGVSNQDLQKEIRNRKNLLARMQLDNKKYGTITKGGAKGTFSKSELEGQINMFNAELNRRSEKRTTVYDLKASYLKDLTEAKKALADFDKSSKTYTASDAEKKRAELQKAVEEAERKYKSLGGDTSGGRSGNTGAHVDTAQEKKDAEEKSSNELLKLLKDNQKAELDLEEETTDKKLKLIELFYDRKKAEIEKKERELAELNKKAGKKGLNDKGLTEEQQKEINKAKEIAQKERDNQKKGVTQEKEKNDAEQRIAYMKEYGNYLEKYGAILDEFNMKRKELSKDDEYGRKLLDKQQEEALGKLEKEKSDKQLKDLSWDTLFQNLDRYTTDYLVRLQQRLKAALDTATEENAALIKQKINEINRIVASNKAGGSDNDILSQNGLLGGSPWGRAAQAIRKQNALEAKAAADSKALTDKQTEILDHYDELGGMDAKDITSKNPKLQGILSAEDMSALQGMEANAEMSGAEASGGQGATALAVTDAIIHGVNQNVQSLGEAADILFGEDSEMNKSVKKFAESSQYATDAFDSLKNGDMVGVALNLGNAISTLGESFGIWSNSNREEIEKENKRLADAMSFNTEALNRLTKKLSESSSATDKFKAYSQAENYLDANEQAQRHIIANNSRMYDGGHSLGYDFGEVSGSSNMLRRLEAFFGKNRGTYNGLAEFIENTSASEMEKFYASEQGVALFNEFSEMIAEASDAGNYQTWVEDLKEYMNAFGKDAREELENSFRAGVTGVTFDGFKDNFKSALMEMDKDVHDFTNDFEKSLMQSVLNAQIEAKFGKELQSLYNDWNDALASDNTLSSQEIENLVSREENLTQRMIAERDRLAAITGYDDSYSSSEAKGSINAAKSMSEDTANELVGRVTAVQLTVERVAAGQQQQSIAITQISGNISTMAAQMPEMRNIADETRTIIANSYLELQEIRENTGAIVQPIQKMQKDISEMKTKL